MTAICRSKNSGRGRSRHVLGAALLVLTFALTAASAFAQQDGAEPKSRPAAVPPAPRPVPIPPATAAAPGTYVPPGYIIGVNDVLAIRFWRQEDVSGDVMVRPDGKISLLLLNDIDAAGLTPEQLRDRIVTAASQFFEEPHVTVIVKEINSRIVFITGMVAKPGPYPLRGPLTVLQLIATAGGLQEYAHRDQIVIMRTENGKQTRLYFNYEVIGKPGVSLHQNIELQPGDTVLVP